MSLFKEKLELKAEEAEYKAQKVMARFEPWQKWLIFICLIGAIVGYFTAKAVAGRYYERQYAKLLIKATPSFTDPKPLLVDRSDIASYGENEYAAVVQITNQNLDLAAKNISYEIKFLSSDGSDAAPSQSGRFYVLPDSRKYLVASKVASQTGVAAINIILKDNPAWQKKITLPQVKLITSKPKGFDQQSPFGYVLEGSFMNDSAYFIKKVDLIFLLYGDGGKVIGASQRSEFDLKPFERRDYKQIWAGISGRNVVNTEAIAETNLLDKENLTAPEFNSNGAGDLGR